MLPQRSPKMLPKLFEGILRCPRIREKSVRKFDGHNLNIKFEKSKLVRLGLIFGFGAPFWGRRGCILSKNLANFDFFEFLMALKIF